MHYEIHDWLTRSIGDSANDATNPVRAPATKYSGLFSRLPIRCGPLRMVENCNTNHAATDTYSHCVISIVVALFALHCYSAIRLSS